MNNGWWRIRAGGTYEGVAMHMNVHGGATAGIHIELPFRVSQPYKLKFELRIPRNLI